MRLNNSRHNRFLGQQVAISVVINAVILPLIIWMIGVEPPDALLGRRAILPGMLLASGLATLLMTVGLTLVVRSGVRSGSILALSLSEVDVVSRMLPSHLLARGVSMSLLAILVLVPAGVVVLKAAPLLPLSSRGFVTWNVLYGVVVGVTMTPFVVRRALADTRLVV